MSVGSGSGQDRDRVVARARGLVRGNTSRLWTLGSGPRTFQLGLKQPEDHTVLAGVMRMLLVIEITFNKRERLP